MRVYAVDEVIFTPTLPHVSVVSASFSTGDKSFVLEGQLPSGFAAFSNRPPLIRFVEKSPQYRSALTVTINAAHSEICINNEFVVSVADFLMAASSTTRESCFDY